MSDSLVTLISYLFNALTLLLVARALLSWFDPGMQTAVGRLLRDVTEPIIAPIRQIVPRMGMLDISPIVALVLLRLIGVLINQALVS